MIETIMFMVIVSAALTGIFNLFETAERHFMIPVQGVQGTYLALERIEAILQDRQVNGFASVLETNPSAIYQDQSPIGGSFANFNRSVTIQGANLAGATLTCTGSAYTSENFKCIIVQVTDTTGKVVGNMTAVVSNYAGT